MPPSKSPAKPTDVTAARQRAAETPVDLFDVSHFDLFEHDTIGPYFERLRKDDPVHHCAHGPAGPYWSVTRYEDVRSVEIDHETYSSDRNVTIVDQYDDFQIPMFIAMDPPEHGRQRRVVQPSVAPRNLKKLEPVIRERAVAILEDLPHGEDFDWVPRVSVELTTQMLATILGFPFEERRRLTRWSDVATAVRSAGVIDSEDQRRRELMECLGAFEDLWEAKRKAAPTNDLVSMLAHAPATQDMRTRPMELLGNIVLLIVGGNDTTRNSISGGVLALHEHPGEWRRLQRDPSLVPNLVHEVIRWQTPLAHMRRTATRDTELGGKRIRERDKVVMWYLSANRDESVFPDGDALVVDRPNASHHLAFGFGLHRCMGAHLANLQLRVLWEEILPRFERIEVVGPPVRVRSNFVRGIAQLPVRVTRR